MIILHGDCATSLSSSPEVFLNSKIGNKPARTLLEGKFTRAVLTSPLKCLLQRFFQIPL